MVARLKEKLTVIEPIPKAVEAVLNQIFRCSEVKPWINWNLGQ